MIMARITSAVAVFAVMACNSGNQVVRESSDTMTDAGIDERTDSASGWACNSNSVNKIIQASNYDQSCHLNMDCALIGQGDTCTPCAFHCPTATVNLTGQYQYQMDTLNSVAYIYETNGQCTAPCELPKFLCCLDGRCQTGPQCLAALGPFDAGAEGAADSSGEPDSGGEDVSGE